ncbi:MAG: BolA family transcriptional regulator [Candidatus Melainabacteria bacterium]|nr:BolA family transcriptional regulator [Candidatus Melainabacteria bacterium]
MVASIVKLVEEKLNAVYQPTYFELVDNSWQHAGHAGNKMGGSHLGVIMVSAVFEGLSTLQRHRHVNNTLKAEMASTIHALELKLFSPEQVTQLGL